MPLLGTLIYVNCFFSACCCTALCIFMFTTKCSNSLVALSVLLSFFFIKINSLEKELAVACTSINHLAAWPVNKVWCNASTKFELKSSEVMRREPYTTHVKSRIRQEKNAKCQSSHDELLKELTPESQTHERSNGKRGIFLAVSLANQSDWPYQSVQIQFRTRVYRIIPECTDSVSKTFPLSQLSTKINDC